MLGYELRCSVRGGSPASSEWPGRLQASQAAQAGGQRQRCDQAPAGRPGSAFSGSISNVASLPAGSTGSTGRWHHNLQALASSKACLGKHVCGRSIPAGKAARPGQPPGVWCCGAGSRRPPASPLEGPCATHHITAALTKLEAAIKGKHVSPGIHTGGHPLVVGAHSRRLARLPATLCRGGRQQAWAEGGLFATASDCVDGRRPKCNWIRPRQAAQPEPHAQTVSDAQLATTQRSTAKQPQAAAGFAPLGWWFSAPSVQASLATSASGK